MMTHSPTSRGYCAGWFRLIQYDDDHRPAFGLVFLFKWVKGTESKSTDLYHSPDLFFANQVDDDEVVEEGNMSA